MDSKLAMKIYNVMIATEGLEKNVEVGSGNNKYKAIGEATVLNEIKPLLKEQKLIMFPSKTVAKEITHDYIDGYGKNKLKSLTQLVITFTLADAETGESIDIEVCGSGYDALDKGAGKASTYAYKIALQKTFMLFSGEDTDNHNTADIVEKQGDGEQPKKVKPEDIIAIAKQKGYEGDALCKKISVKKIDDIKFLKADRKVEVYNKLAALADK